MIKPKVFIYPGDSYHAAIEMFERRGFEVVKHFEGLSLVCFLGGTDVDPEIYNEERGPYTQAPDVDRDYTEVVGFHRCKSQGIPMVGICRGGQLLNVLNGGEMIQHLGKCISGVVKDDSGRELLVDHHQGMLCTESDSSELISYLPMPQWEVDWPDYVVYYRETKSLCFQPHPEWGHKGTEDYFFELIKDHLGLEGKV